MSQFIKQCDDRFAFECPKRWSELTKTDRANVRFCNTCSDHVYFCTNADEIAEHKHKRHCVAIESNLLESEIQTRAATEPNEIEPFIHLGTLTPDGIQSGVTGQEKATEPQEGKPRIVGMILTSFLALSVGGGSMKVWIDQYGALPGFFLGIATGAVVFAIGAILGYFAARVSQ